MNYIIITGASQGLGESIAENLLGNNNHLFCISRKKNDRLISKAKDNGVKIDYFKYDLNRIDDLETLMQDIFSKIEVQSARSIVLINNAGTVAPIRPISKCESAEVINNLNVNLVAPILLTSIFIKNTSSFNIEKRVINISSGAGKKPYYGWSCYCSSKAGLDLFTQCVGVEEESKEYPVKILSFAPGIIDTDMQKEIRHSNKEDFAQLERFLAFKEEGKLMSSEFVSSIITKLLFDENFKQGAVTDISDFS